MIKHMTKLTGWTASLVALAATASADVKVNDYLSLNGYAAASGTYADPDTGKSKETLFNSGSPELDVIKVALVGKYGDFGGKVSLMYVPNRTNANTAGILDAYATYTKGDFVVTAGQFLSYLGYEAFDTSNMLQLTYGANIFSVPTYHSGVKVDYTISKTLTAGVAVVDSVFSSPTSGWAPYSSGDGKFNKLGTEAYVSYTGIDKLTLWTGFAYDDNQTGGQTVIGDFWASYALSAKTTLATEVIYDENAGSGYLAEVQYVFTDKVSGVVRVSGKHVESGDTGSYFTVSPTYKFTSNFLVRGEISYADAAESTNGTQGLLATKGMLYGVQALFTF